jgi:tetratricopeptide (TPR) repeat protein
MLGLLAGCATATTTDRALSLVRQGRDAEAVTLLRSRLHDKPDDIPARKLLVRVLAMNGDVGAVQKEVDELSARLPPDDPTPQLELGHAYELGHKFEEALAAYDSAADRAPKNPAGPTEGGLRAAHWGEAEDAKVRLEEAVRRGSRDPNVFHALGLVRLKLGDAVGAEQAYRTGLMLDPDALENYLGLATAAIVRDDALAALGAYEALLKKRPKFAAAELGRAWALAKLGRADEARKAIDRAESLGAPKDSIAKQRAALNSLPAASP